MPYIFENAETLVGKPPVGNKQCVALVKQFAKAPASSLWSEGIKVKGASLKPGTAIATFVHGKYPNLPSGNHAAFYLSQDAQGIWVVDQWTRSKTIRKRHLRFLGSNKDNSYNDRSNNGDAFSVIE